MEKKYDKLPLKFIGVTVPFSSNHLGVDFGWNDAQGGPNVPVYAATDGIVTMATSWGTAGNTVRVRYDSPNKDYSIFTQYKHLSKFSVKSGSKVIRGQQVGNMGGSGGFSPHLHFDYVKTPYQYNYQQSDSDRAKYSLNPLDYCYLFENQVVGDSAKLVKRVVNTSLITTRDTTKNQIEVIGSLNCRKGAGTNQTILGLCDYGIYDFYETKEGNGYTWYRIGDNRWIAGIKGDTVVYKGENMEEEIKVLKLRIAELEQDIVEKDKTILEQKAKIEELESRTWLSMFIDWIKGLAKKG